MFQDIQKKCDGGELSTKPLDLRGLLAAVRLMRTGWRATGRWIWALSTSPLMTLSGSWCGT